LTVVIKCLYPFSQTNDITYLILEQIKYPHAQAIKIEIKSFGDRHKKFNRKAPNEKCSLKNEKTKKKMSPLNIYKKADDSLPTQKIHASLNG